MVLSKRTAPTLVHDDSYNSGIRDFTANVSLQKGYYYINLHINPNGSGTVNGDPTWKLTGATAIYTDNGAGNYRCNALYQGLIYTDGGTVSIKYQNTGAYGSKYPIVFKVYKI